MPLNPLRYPMTRSPLAILFCRRRANSVAAPRRRLTLECLEDRVVPAVQYVAGPLQAPAVNRADVGLGNNSGANFQEPYVSINPLDPGNLILSSHAGMRLSTNAS